MTHDVQAPEVAETGLSIAAKTERQGYIHAFRFVSARKGSRVSDWAATAPKQEVA